MGRLDRGRTRLWSAAEVSAERAFDHIQGYCLIDHRKPLVWLALLEFRGPDSMRGQFRIETARYGRGATSVAALHQNWVDGDGANTGLVTAVGLSASGFRFYPDEHIPGSAPFREGLAARGRQKAPEVFATAEFGHHDAVIVLAGTEGQLNAAKRELEHVFQSLATVTWEFGETGKRDHLGFEDGISQPLFFEVTSKGPPPNQLRPDPTTALGIVVADPLATEEYGSFLAYVRFKLDVSRFESTAHEIAVACGTSDDEAKSWFLGRHPLTSAPLAPAGKTNNDFTFAADPNFKVCPAGAHIRAMSERTRKDNLNRIYRRGTPYRRSSEIPGEPDERGLLFQCFQSSLEQGFEKLFFEWGQGTVTPSPGNGPDALLWPRAVAPHPSGMDVTLGPTQPFATVRDGEYFYFPDLRFFQRVPKQ